MDKYCPHCEELIYEPLEGVALDPYGKRIVYYYCPICDEEIV